MSEEIIKIFYSYSRKDLDMRNTLEDHLSALREGGKISTWHDLELEAGTEWEPTILNKLDTADIILLLISRNFISSKYCYGEELKRAIARHNQGTAKVVPIILSPCDWNHSDVPFSPLNALPTHAKPITSWADQEEAFAMVAQQIRKMVVKLRDKKQVEQQTEAQKKQQLLTQKEAKDKSEQERIQREEREATEEKIHQVKLEQEAEKKRQRELDNPQRQPIALNTFSHWFISQISKALSHIRRLLFPRSDPQSADPLPALFIKSVIVGFGGGLFAIAIWSDPNLPVVSNHQLILVVTGFILALIIHFAFWRDIKSTRFRFQYSKWLLLSVLFLLICLTTQFNVFLRPEPSVLVLLQTVLTCFWISLAIFVHIVLTQLFDSI